MGGWKGRVMSSLDTGDGEIWIWEGFSGFRGYVMSDRGRNRIHIQRSRVVALIKEDQDLRIHSDPLLSHLPPFVLHIDVQTQGPELLLKGGPRESVAGNLSLSRPQGRRALGKLALDIISFTVESSGT